MKNCLGKRAVLQRYPVSVSYLLSSKPFLPVRRIERSRMIAICHTGAAVPAPAIHRGCYLPRMVRKMLPAPWPGENVGGIEFLNLNSLIFGVLEGKQFRYS